MNTHAFKKMAAQAALEHIKTFSGGVVLGVGTGSTVNELIALLPQVRGSIKKVVASSKATAKALEAQKFYVEDLNNVQDLDLYIDGADEVNQHGEMIKGGGAALTGERLVSANAKEFLCIADESKLVSRLGSFPVPVEVIPMARSLVARRLVEMGGTPHYRQGTITDYGNIILDVEDLKLDIPLAIEEEIYAIAGVVTVGIFSKITADRIILGTDQGIKELDALGR